MIKFIDFGGACTWAKEEGLTGLVGTPQYVAPEVVTGYGEDMPTEAPYGKGCDIVSIAIVSIAMVSRATVSITIVTIAHRAALTGLGVRVGLTGLGVRVALTGLGARHGQG